MTVKAQTKAAGGGGLKSETPGPGTRIWYDIFIANGCILKKYKKRGAF